MRIYSINDAMLEEETEAPRLNGYRMLLNIVFDRTLEARVRDLVLDEMLLESIIYERRWKVERVGC